MPTSSRINLFRELTSVFIILAFMLAFAMRPSDRRRFAVLIASLAVLNILLFAAQLRLRSDSEPNDVDAREQSELQPQQERGEPVQARSTAASVTLLLRDFEEWSHQLSAVAAAVERHSLQVTHGAWPGFELLYSLPPVLFLCLLACSLAPSSE